MSDVKPKTLREIRDAAIADAFHRHSGRVRAIARELGISHPGVCRYLRILGLAEPTRRRQIREIDIARAFQKHRAAICFELKIQDSTLMRWIEKRLPELLAGSR